MEPPVILQSLIQSCPEPARSFLNQGGWLAVTALLGLIILLVLYLIVRRALVRRPRQDDEPELTEVLGEYPPPPALGANQRLTLYGLPVRLRLVIAAPLGNEAGVVNYDDVGEMLDQIRPSLKHFVYADMPRIRAWPTQLSHQGFLAAFRRHAIMPDPPNRPSRWVLLMGRMLIDGRPIGLGMALLADQENTLGRAVLEHPHQWVEALRVKTGAE